MAEDKGRADQIVEDKGCADQIAEHTAHASHAWGPGLRDGGALILALVLGAATWMAHRSDLELWHIGGSFFGLLALTIVCRTLAGWWKRLPPSRAETLAGYLALLTIAGTAVALVHPFLLGRLPVSGDHAVHLYKAWRFWEHLLDTGRSSGWSSDWFFGYPADDLYPPGPDIWIAAFRLVTLGLGSWEFTYGLAFVCAFLFSAWAVHTFGRAHLGTLAGWIAAMLLILDPGAVREGGWVYVVTLGVWAQSLAMAFTLLTLNLLKKGLERRRPLDFVLASLLSACALLTHPMSVILFGAGVPLYLVTRWAVGGKRFSLELTWSVGVLGLGAALAGFWYVPMLSRSEYTKHIGVFWQNLDVLAGQLVNGTIFLHVLAPIPLLALVGAALGLLSRRWAVFFLTLFALTLLLGASSTTFDVLNLATLSQAFTKLQYQRFLIPAKTAFFLLAGFAVRELVSLRIRARAAGIEPTSLPTRDSQSAHDEPRAVGHGRTAHDEPRAVGHGRTAQDVSGAARPMGLRSIAATLLLCLIVAPFVRPVLVYAFQRYTPSLATLQPLEGTPLGTDFQRFLWWSAQARHQSNTFHRIAYELEPDYHRFMTAPIYNQTPYYKVGYTPAKLFNHITETANPDLYRALSVKYVVSLEPLTRPTLQLETTIGRIHVYRFPDFRPERYTLSGPGAVAVKAFDDQRIALHLTGTDVTSRLKLHVARYPRWEARLNGRPVPIRAATVYESAHPILMGISPLEDGDLVLEYVTRPEDMAGMILTLAGLFVVAMLVFLAGSRSKRDRLAPLASTLRAHLVRVSTPVAGLLLAGLLVWGVNRARDTGRGPALPEASFLRTLREADVRLEGRPCARLGDRAWSCSRDGAHYDVELTRASIDGWIKTCVQVQPSDKASITVRFPPREMGHMLIGYHGLTDRTRPGRADQSQPGPTDQSQPGPTDQSQPGPTDRSQPGPTDQSQSGPADQSQPDQSDPGQAENTPDASITVGLQVDDLTVGTVHPARAGNWEGFGLDIGDLEGKQARVGVVIKAGQAPAPEYCFDLSMDP